MRRLVIAPLWLAACSTGLTPLGHDTETDTDTSPDTDVPDTDDTEVENGAPVADAGDDQGAYTGSVVQLDGSGSADPDDDVLAYRWDLVSKPAESTAILINDFRVDPQFYADVPGAYVLELEVDDSLAQDVDEITVTVEDPNDAPIADAGPDQAVTVGATVQLNGGASWDPDDDPLTYQWTITTRPNGSSVQLSDATSVTPRFTADAPGQFIVSLVVSDGTFTSSPSSVDVLAEATSSSGGGDCGSCAAYVTAAQRRTRGGSTSSGLGLMMLPFGWLFLVRARNARR
jgi:hypothetical protein